MVAVLVAAGGRSSSWESWQRQMSYSSSSSGSITPGRRSSCTISSSRGTRFIRSSRGRNIGSGGRSIGW